MKVAIKFVCGVICSAALQQPHKTIALKWSKEPGRLKHPGVSPLPQT